MYKVQVVVYERSISEANENSGLVGDWYDDTAKHHFTMLGIGIPRLEPKALAINNGPVK